MSSKADNQEFLYGRVVESEDPMRSYGHTVFCHVGNSRIWRWKFCTFPM